ncbi:MAG: hypothetical protein WCB99_06010 [Candidatus Cybelea sp.]
MKNTVIRYKVKPERIEENRQLIAAVFAELSSKAPEGISYANFAADDGTFVHIVASETEDRSALTSLRSFERFTQDVADRFLESAQVADVTIVGNYRLLTESLRG